MLADLDGTLFYISMEYLEAAAEAYQVGQRLKGASGYHTSSQSENCSVVKEGKNYAVVQCTNITHRPLHSNRYGGSYHALTKNEDGTVTTHENIARHGKVCLENLCSSGTTAMEQVNAYLRLALGDRFK